MQPDANRFPRRRSLWWTCLLLACAGTAAAPAFSQASHPAPGAVETAATATQAPDAETRLPAATTTRHSLVLDGDALSFTATAGAITLSSPQGRPEADIAYVAYALETSDAGARPVTFAVNGGPGAASAYLQIGAIGPWRLPMDAGRIVPSQRSTLVSNPDSWLGFTDLVFIDPVGTGFSRLVSPDDALRGRYLSVDGDIDALADFIRRWLVANDRLRSPVYFVGESYGGFRGPLVAEKLQTDEGVAFRGLTLLSPVLDFGWWRQPDYAPLAAVSLLPSLAAAAMEANGSFSPAGVRTAEDYAAGDYLSDLLRGLGDPSAVARIVDRVTALTGLDREAVTRASGRIDGSLFAREALRSDGRRISPYDATVASTDPAPGDTGARAADPVLDAMTAPLTAAMTDFYRDTLGWLPDRRYILLNGGVSKAWDWETGRDQPEAVSALRRVMALDPEVRVLVAHGYTDLVTPYFANELILRQLPPAGPEPRARLAAYRGGHMFYLRGDSRRAFMGDARWVYAGSG